MPEVYKMICHCIPVISARSIYETKLPGMINEWKKATFADLFKITSILKSDNVINLIVIGDSNYEMEAGRSF